MTVDLVSSLESLVKATANCHDQALRDIFTSFKKISVDSIKSNKVFFFFPPKYLFLQLRPLFAATKIVEISMVNISRIVKYWDIISEHLLDLTNNKDSSIRNFSVDSTTHMIGTALALKLPQINYNETPFALQNSFFQFLEKLAQSPLAEIQEKSLQTMYQILHSSGQVCTRQYQWSKRAVELDYGLAYRAVDAELCST